MAPRVGNREHDCHLRIKLGVAVLLEVVRGIELQPVLARGEPTLDELSDTTVCVGGPAADNGPPPVGPAVAEGDRHAFGRATARRVENMRRNAHELSMLLRRRRVIFRCSSAASWSSVAGSFSIRWRKAATTSSALRPAAEIRNTWPNLSS